MIGALTFAGMYDRRVLDPDFGPRVDPECARTRLQEVRIFDRTGFEPDGDKRDAADLLPDQQVHVGIPGG